MNKELLANSKTKRSLQRVAERTVNLGEIERHCPTAREQVRKATALTELDLVRDIKGNEKSF